ncbi:MULTISPECIES: response regulator transcription factor [unclassified Streptomyces]|uniref:response regulator transcription factor n=1 Tax=Streptomycetaceae TaxID=2062 RepID=UPI002E766192|nr:MULTISPECIES: response regulator transcription factor [unclassified Streptomyces]MED7948665.1 response regulator transcription factor [Streptomyces sp. BE303]MEE1828393.1 response regulator transcription factor [Streptomyces sp. BE20]
MIRLLLAEDQHVVRSALVALLELEPDLEVVAQTGSADDVVPRALVFTPDVAVLDIEMPGRLDGLQAAAALKERVPGCRTLMLTSNGRPGLLRRALEAKVDGFLLKTAPPEELVAAIRQVAGGGRVLDPGLAVAAWDLADNPLTPRENDVLRELAEGAEPPEIATRLHLSTGTVRNVLTAVVGKLNARNRTDAVRIARDAGWL